MSPAPWENPRNTPPSATDKALQRQPETSDPTIPTHEIDSQDTTPPSSSNVGSPDESSHGHERQNLVSQRTEVQEAVTVESSAERQPQPPPPTSVDTADHVPDNQKEIKEKEV